ncbi:hypothetical protein HNS38_11155, partial [Lentimicrobium sp. L6]|nr:hypothetical protein [Lentimicrobium sp. L6]
MKYISTFILIFSLAFGFAQNNPIDFEAGGNGADWTWATFENSTNPPLEIIPNPFSGDGNTTTTVAKFTALDAGMDWAGCETLDIGSFTFDEDNSLIKLWVYKDILSQVKIKLEGTGGNVESYDVLNTLTGQWEELTFDFSAVIGNTYNKLVVFPDFAARDQDNIIYFDEMTFNAGSAPAAPVIAAPVPSHDQADVVSVYSGTYTDIAETNFNPNWGQSTAISFVDVAGNETMKYANFNYQGINLGSNDGTVQDLSAMEFLHVDIWTADATVVKLTPISASTGEFLYELTPLTQGTWNSYDIPVGDFTDVSMADIHQLKFDGQAGVNPSNIYLDNIYFYKEPTTATEPSAAAPLPTEDAEDVVSIYSDSYTNLAGTDFNPGWGQTTVVSNEDIGGNEMMKYASFNYQGTQLDGNQDLSAMEFLHVDIWTADATVVKLTPISASTGEF